MRRLGFALLALSLGVLVSVPAYWFLTRDKIDQGSLEELGLPSAGEGTRALPVSPPLEQRQAGQPAQAPEGVESVLVPVVPVHPARLSELPAPVPPPVALRIPAIGVRAAVEPVGVDPESMRIAVPSDRTTVAWYRHGPSPGEAGSSVLAAHVDLGGKPGVFFGLRRLKPGAIVVVGYAGGAERRFEVVARREYRKDNLPAERMFATDGRSVLTLVTCGGGFSETTREYDSNIVVFAVPLTESAAGTPVPRPA